jgi:hypothetical protein
MTTSLYLIPTKPAKPTNPVSIQFPLRPVDHEMCIYISLPTNADVITQLSTVMIQGLNYYANDIKCTECDALCHEIKQDGPGYFHSL